MVRVLDPRPLIFFSVSPRASSMVRRGTGIRGRGVAATLHTSALILAPTAMSLNLWPCSTGRVELFTNRMGRQGRGSSGSTLCRRYS